MRVSSQLVGGRGGCHRRFQGRVFRLLEAISCLSKGQNWAGRGGSRNGLAVPFFRRRSLRVTSRGGPGLGQKALRQDGRWRRGGMNVYTGGPCVYVHFGRTRGRSGMLSSFGGGATFRTRCGALVLERGQLQQKGASGLPTCTENPQLHFGVALHVRHGRNHVRCRLVFR